VIENFGMGDRFRRNAHTRLSAVEADTPDQAVEMAGWDVSGLFLVGEFADKLPVRRRSTEAEGNATDGKN
jgi:hypothetical protein